MFEAIIKRGTLMTVFVLIVSVLGIVAAFRIPIQMIPDLEVRTITIRTAWPGATPQDVEKEIVIEQEEYLRSIPGLQRILSESSFGRANIELEFPFGIDLNETLIHVNNALSQVPSYPNNVDEPRIYATSFSSNSFMYFRVAPLKGNPRNLDMVLMQDFVDDHVRTQMETVQGVSLVNVYGGAERQVQVLLDPQKLSERDITISDVRDAIIQRNRDISGGELEQGKRRYLLRTMGRFRDLQELRDLILTRRGDSIIRLGDVSQVKLDHFELSRLSYTDGDPVIGLSVRRQAGSNVINIKNDLMKEMEIINRDILNPAGMYMRLIADDVGYVKSSIQNVIRCVERCDLHVADVVLEPLASADAVLSEDEKEIGVAVVDIGGGTTDVIMYAEGGICHTSAVPAGGNNITSDVAAGLRTPVAEAERLKRNAGCALGRMIADDEEIEVPGVGGHPPRRVARRLLGDIIEPRVEEIFSEVRRRMEETGVLEQVSSGCVLTGGAALMEGMVECAEEILGMPIRLGQPIGVKGITQLVQGPQYATGVGLIRYGAQQLAEARGRRAQQEASAEPADADESSRKAGGGGFWRWLKTAF